jgi:hypothetical protein
LESKVTELNLNTNLARDLAWEMVGSKFDEGGDHYEVIENVQIDSNRWMGIYLLTVKINSKFFQTTYEKGLTENQDNGPFEDEGETVLFYQVIPQEKTIVEYVRYTESV